METFNPIPPILSRTAAMIASVCLCLPINAGEPTSREKTSESGISADILEAQELLIRGDDAYQKGRYGQAIEAYAGARDALTQATDSVELRTATTERYAQASVEHARQLAKKGDVAGAKATVDKVLLEQVAPQHAAALTLRAQLDDPIRTNPALTPEHVADINSVRQSLYTAEGAFNLGKFDQAKATYENVLRIDPTNIAARRGMEQVAAAKSDYQKSAYDHSRAQMLSQVDAAWETTLSAPDLAPDLVDPFGTSSSSLGPITITAKLNQIIIPNIALDQATIQETLDFLRVKSAEYDLLETDPTRKGVNFNLDIGAADSEIAKRILSDRFDLKLKQVPLSKALKYLSEQTRTEYTTDDFAVVIKPVGSVSDKLISRSYRVPPDFLTGLSSAAPTDAAATDPFADSTPRVGLLTTRLSAKEALVKHGIPFPENATASYSAPTNTLTVVNAPSQHDMIDQLVHSMTNSEPVMISVQVTMIKAEQTLLNELGFDWLLNPVSLNSDGSLIGTGGTVGSGSPRTGADVISPVGSVTLGGVPTTPGVPVNPGLMTNGLRSGDYAINQNSLDNIINNNDRSSQQRSVAPGVLAVTGLFTDGQVQTVMRGLNQKKGVDILSKPSVITRSSQQASISIVREFIYPTEYEPPQIPTSVGSGSQSTPVTPATPTAFEKKDVGIQLEVLPVADADKRFVDITLAPSFSDFDGFVNYGSPINSVVRGSTGSQSVELTKNAILMPVFSINKLNTQLSVADGSTIAIGGLLSESIQNVNDGVPILGSIPWIGRFFRSEAKQPVSTALIFLVHVELLDPTGRPYRDR